MQQVDQGVQIRRVMLEQHFGVSEKTAKRDIRELVERGTLRFERTTRPGYYRR